MNKRYLITGTLDDGDKAQIIIRAENESDALKYCMKNYNFKRITNIRLNTIYKKDLFPSYVGSSLNRMR